MLCLCARNLLVQFGLNVLGLPECDVESTPAYRSYELEAPEEAKLLFKSRVLAYAKQTWTNHASNIWPLIEYCFDRRIGFFTCTASVINLFQLYLAESGKSYQTIERILSSVAFIYRFFLVPNAVADPAVAEVKRFTKKACINRQNKKSAFGSAEIRKIWAALDEKKGGVEKLNCHDLRTFVMAVFQHKTFCRYSDLKSIKISDVQFHCDYFKILVRFSKTDQGGLGSYVYLAKPTSGSRDPHTLLCYYFMKMNFAEEDDMYLFPPLK